MPKTFLSDVWDETRLFLRREWGLLVPVALATLGLGALLLLFNVPPPVNGALPEGDWVWWLAPFALLYLFGAVALSDMALRPGMAVGDALASAVRILPRAIASGCVIAGVSGLALFIVLVVLLLAVPPMAAAQNAATLFSIVAMFVSARILLAFALLSEGRGPIGALSESWRLTAPLKWRLTLLLLLYSLVSALILIFVQFSIGSVLLLIGRLTGHAELTMRLTQVATTFTWATLQMAALVYSALLARRLIARR